MTILWSNELFQYFQVDVELIWILWHIYFVSKFELKIFRVQKRSLKRASVKIVSHKYSCNMKNFDECNLQKMHTSLLLLTTTPYKKVLFNPFLQQCAISALFAPWCISRPPGVGFARSKVCSTRVHVLWSYVSSFEVKFQELMTPWYMPWPTSGVITRLISGHIFGFGGQDFGIRGWSLTWCLIVSFCWFSRRLITQFCTQLLLQ